MKALITFGCSWSLGIGSWYDREDKDLSSREYKTYSNKAYKDWKTGISSMYKNSYREILTARHDYKNVNFATGGSSNMKQFRFAEEYFNTDDYKKYDEVMVLWGITSTARTDLWSTKKNPDGKYETYFLTEIDEKKEIVKILREEHYNHDVEVKRLSTQIQHWDRYFESIGVKNYWYDTFNHHNYEYNSRNMIMGDKNPRDLMSNLCIDQGMKLHGDNYHFSNWFLDNDRIKFLLNKKLVNPHSYHPNKQAGLLLADIIDKFILW